MIFLFITIMKESDHTTFIEPILEDRHPQKVTLILEGIVIHGCKDFVHCSKEALSLLLSKSESFHTVKSYLGRIEQGKTSTIHVNTDVPTFEVNERTWRHSVIWYAGAIAHDTYHSYLYHIHKIKNIGNEPHPDSWRGSNAESICLDFQLKVLIELEAPESILEYIKRIKKDPNYRGSPYWSSAQDQDW